MGRKKFIFISIIILFTIQTSACSAEGQESQGIWHNEYESELNSHPSFPFCKRVSHFESDLQILYPTFHFCNDFPVFFLAFMI